MWSFIFQYLQMFICYPLPLIVGCQQNVNFPGPSEDSLVLLAGILLLEGNRSSGSVWLEQRENLLPHMLFLLLFSCPVVSNALQFHGLQHTRSPCPSPSPGICPSSCSLHEHCKQTTHWKNPWCWERLRAEGAEGVRRWDGWTALMQTSLIGLSYLKT